MKVKTNCCKQKRKAKNVRRSKIFRGKFLCKNGKGCIAHIELNEFY